MDEVLLFRQLGISVLLGLLVGLQRERTESEMAGFRTFPLITIFGTLCAMLGTIYGNASILGGGFAGVITLVLIGNIPKLKQEQPDGREDHRDGKKRGFQAAFSAFAAPDSGLRPGE